MELNHAEIRFTNINEITKILSVTHQRIGWEDSYSTISTFLYPDRVLTPKLQTSEIELVNSSNLNIDASSTKFSGSIYQDSLYRVLDSRDMQSINSSISELWSAIGSLSTE